jgi:hypothetical protein
MVGLCNKELSICVKNTAFYLVFTTFMVINDLDDKDGCRLSSSPVKIQNGQSRMEAPLIHTQGNLI